MLDHSVSVLLSKNSLSEKQQVVARIGHSFRDYGRVTGDPEVEIPFGRLNGVTWTSDKPPKFLRFSLKLTLMVARP
jgi:hypothetical protein